MRPIIGRVGLCRRTWPINRSTGISSPGPDDVGQGDPGVVEVRLDADFAEVAHLQAPSGDRHVAVVPADGLGEEGEAVDPDLGRFGELQLGLQALGHLVLGHRGGAEIHAHQHAEHDDDDDRELLTERSFWSGTGVVRSRDQPRPGSVMATVSLAHRMIRSAKSGVTELSACRMPGTSQSSPLPASLSATASAGGK